MRKALYFGKGYIRRPLNGTIPGMSNADCILHLLGNKLAKEKIRVNLQL